LGEGTNKKRERAEVRNSEKEIEQREKERKRERERVPERARKAVSAGLGEGTKPQWRRNPINIYP